MTLANRVLRVLQRRALGTPDLPPPRTDVGPRAAAAEGLPARNLALTDLDDWLDDFDEMLAVSRARREQHLAPAGLCTASLQTERRGIALLLENLTPEQRRQFTGFRHFDVIGGESGKRYRIWHCYHQNIEELDMFGRRTCVWCVHPSGVVLGDVLLAQKTALELFESDALRIAYRYSDFSSTTGPYTEQSREIHRRTCEGM